MRTLLYFILKVPDACSGVAAVSGSCLTWSGSALVQPGESVRECRRRTTSARSIPCTGLEQAGGAWWRWRCERSSVWVLSFYTNQNPSLIKCTSSVCVLAFVSSLFTEEMKVEGLKTNTTWMVSAKRVACLIEHG